MGRGTRGRGRASRTPWRLGGGVRAPTRLPDSPRPALSDPRSMPLCCCPPPKPCLQWRHRRNGLEGATGLRRWQIGAMERIRTAELDSEPSTGLEFVAPVVGIEELAFLLVAAGLACAACWAAGPASSVLGVLGSVSVGCGVVAHVASSAPSLT